jgi:hypothetical protein
MSKRKWIFGSLFFASGIVVGYMFTRAGTSTARSTIYEGVGIPLAISSLQPPIHEQASINLTDMAYCHKISSFGNYLTYDRDEFTAGQEVLLYVEIAGFRSESIPGGKFRTLLKSELEFFRDGELHQSVEEIDLPETVDVCRRQRNDYFHSYQFAIPQTLTGGRYALKLKVQDQLGHSEASRSLPFVLLK